jgi:hypothetical protein
MFGQRLKYAVSILRSISNIGGMDCPTCWWNDSTLNNWYWNVNLPANRSSREQSYTIGLFCVRAVRKLLT